MAKIKPQENKNDPNLPDQEHDQSPNQNKTKMYSLIRN
jgi:hypothetical protein